MGHFLRCHSRRTWQTALLRDLQRILLFPTCPRLHQVLMEAVLSVFRNIEPAPPFGEIPSIQSVVQSQKSIGWDNMLYGHFSFHWARHQQEYLEATNKQSVHLNGSMWQQRIVLVLWKHIHQNWLDRNNDLHGADHATREAVLVAQAQAEILELYGQRHLVLPRGRDLFYPSLAHHFTAEPTSRGLRQWLLTYKSLILKSIKLSSTTQAHTSHTITQYFTQQ